MTTVDSFRRVSSIAQARCRTALGGVRDRHDRERLPRPRRGDRMARIRAGDRTVPPEGSWSEHDPDYGRLRRNCGPAADFVGSAAALSVADRSPRVRIPIAEEPTAIWLALFGRQPGESYIGRLLQVK
jgi:hypothetical protein